MNKLDLLQIAFTREHAEDYETKLEQAVLGCMCGHNFECIRYLCQDHRESLLSHKSRIIMLLFDNKEHMSRYRSTSLGLLFKDLELDSGELIRKEIRLAQCN